MIRAFAILVCVSVVVMTAGFAYGVLSDLSGSARVLASRWDTPANDDRVRRAFVVHEGQSAAEIGNELHAQGLIRSPVVFRLLIEARGVGGTIESGEYQLSPSMTTSEIVSSLAQGARRQGVKFTIPEGWRAEQVAQRLGEMGLIAGPDFMAVVRARESSPMSDVLPPGVSLEGYLFPDTYEVSKDAGADKLVQTMVEQFNRKLTAQMRTQAKDRGLTVHQAVTLASIVEREAARAAEQPIIASVYLNRLRVNMPLQADPTVQFAVASQVPVDQLGASLWKRDLTRTDLQLQSPYNTYVHRGLPPAPICSPGLGALEAVINPATTDYYYFVARGDGSHAFARTPEEHRANVQKYLGNQ